MSYIKIGKISGTHGLEGGLRVIHQLSGKNPFAKVEFVFIEMLRESYIPFYITSRKKTGDGEIWIRLEDITSVEAARELSGKDVYLPADEMPEDITRSVNNVLVGYMISDQVLGELGKIETLFETPGQVIAVIRYLDNEVLIPIIDATLRDIDHVRKMVVVTLPDGLLDIYQ